MFNPYTALNEDDKKQAKAAADKIKNKLIGWGIPAQWARLLAAALIGAAIGALSTCQTGCSSVTPEQVQRAHALYHTVTGEPCQIFPGK